MKLYREVKASDRLPTEEELYFVYYKGDNDQYYKHLLLYDDGEWMDSYTGKPWDDFNGIWLEPHEPQTLDREKVRKVLDDFNVQPPKTQIEAISPDSFHELQKSPHIFKAYLTDALCSLALPQKPEIIEGEIDKYIDAMSILKKYGLESESLIGGQQTLALMEECAIIAIKAILKLIKGE